MSWGMPWTNNIYKSRADYNHRGDMNVSRSLNNQPQQGHVITIGQDYNQRLNLRKYNQLYKPEDAPNASIFPQLSQSNRNMVKNIEQQLDISI